jgi:hypothetical protein
MMKKFALILGALGLAGAAMFAGEQSASAAPAGATAPQAQTAARSDVEQVRVRNWHESGPSRMHKRWRSHHRRGSGHGK